MRWLRLFLLGVASVYPIYWTAQFVLFFLPAALGSLLFRLPLRVVDISYLQATAVAGKAEPLPPGFESLLFAVLFALVIWYFRGDQFLTAGLAIVILGQSALLPFFHQIFAPTRPPLFTFLGLVVSLGIVCFGLYRIVQRTGGRDFIDRLALLSLLIVLPEAALWLVFRMRYPFFGTRFLVTLLLPVYVGSLLVSALPQNSVRRTAKEASRPVPLVEIFAGFVVTTLLFAAISLTTRTGERQHVIASVSSTGALREPAWDDIFPMDCKGVRSQLSQGAVPSRA